MKRIPLTKGYWAIVDDRDYEWLMQWKWQAVVKLRGNYLYVTATRSTPRDSNGKRRSIPMHREVWERHKDPIPEGATIDYIHHGDFGALDNRLDNLRLADQRLQNHNKRASVGATSQYRCVSWAPHMNKWRASCKDPRGKNLTLGYFDDEIEAAVASDRAIFAMYQENATLNFPEIRENWVGLTVEDIFRERDERKVARKERTTSKYVGVRFHAKHKNPWLAEIRVDGRSKYIGCFATEEAAARAFDAYAIEHGLNKKLNFPETNNSEV